MEFKLPLPFSNVPWFVPVLIHNLLCPSIILLKYCPSSCILVLQICSFLYVSAPKPRMHFPPYIPHAPPISTTRSHSQYNVGRLCCSNSHCQSSAPYSPALTNVLPMVRSSARDSQRFTVSVNVEPQKEVNFKLTYEELLNRKLGTYKHVINLDPGQIVNDLKVTTRIEESSNITTLKVPALRMSNEILEDPSGKHSLNTASSCIGFWSWLLRQRREGVRS